MIRYAFKMLLILLTVATIGGMSAGAQAEEQHHHGAHVHGIAHLNVALEGKNLYMEFVSPAANIVGFEHAPKNQAAREAVEAARNTLENAEAVFKLPPAAGARLIEATRTAQVYRMFALPPADSLPARPGLIRDDEKGAAIEIEIWSVPAAAFGSFVDGIAAPLGIGKLEIAGGREVSGFLCESRASGDAEEITELGSWRRFVAGG